MAGELDIQSMLTHEFGHVLGLAHQRVDGTCGNEVTTTTSTCAGNPNQASMSSSLAKGAGETCQRTLETDDTESANNFY